jgi:hypothetical protein
LNDDTQKNGVREWITNVLPKIQYTLRMSNGDLAALCASLLAELAEYFDHPTTVEAVKILAKYARILASTEKKIKDDKCLKKSLIVDAEKTENNEEGD